MSRISKSLPDSTPVSHAGRLTRFGLLGAVLLLGLLLVPVPAVAQDGKAQQLYSDMGCAICHGEHGRKARGDTYPIIAGQTERYVYLALNAHKNGDRKGGGANMHSEVSDLLTDADMHLLAKYVAAMK